MTNGKSDKPVIIGIIPARMASSRFPGKPLALIHGEPMLRHVLYRCKMSKDLEEVYVATCDQDVVDYVESLGGKAVMTSDKHERASDRIAECMLKVEEKTGRKVDIVVMIQGDEPMVVPEMIEESIKPMLSDESIMVVNLMSNMNSVDEFNDPNEVKVVVDKRDYALYFSREPIPSRKKGVNEVPMLKQVCIIPFTRDFLIMFNELEPTPLEIIESIDMLRVLEHGYRVKMVMTSHNSYSVDTPEDLKNVENQMKDDKIMKGMLKG